jgi:hypothetical protein
VNCTPLREADVREATKLALVMAARAAVAAPSIGSSNQTAATRHGQRTMEFFTRSPASCN